MRQYHGLNWLKQLRLSSYLIELGFLLNTWVDNLVAFEVDIILAAFGVDIILAAFGVDTVQEDIGLEAFVEDILEPLAGRVLPVDKAIMEDNLEPLADRDMVVKEDILEP